VPAQPGIAPDITDLDVLKPFITSRAIASVRGNRKKLSKEGASKENVGKQETSMSALRNVNLKWLPKATGTW